MQKIKRLICLLLASLILPLPSPNLSDRKVLAEELELEAQKGFEFDFANYLMKKEKTYLLVKKSRLEELKRMGQDVESDLRQVEVDRQALDRLETPLALCLEKAAFEGFSRAALEQILQVLRPLLANHGEFLTEEARLLTYPQNLNETPPFEEFLSFRERIEAQIMKTEKEKAEVFRLSLTNDYYELFELESGSLSRGLNIFIEDKLQRLEGFLAQDFSRAIKSSQMISLKDYRLREDLLKEGLDQISLKNLSEAKIQEKALKLEMTLSEGLDPKLKQAKEELSKAFSKDIEEGLVALKKESLDPAKSLRLEAKAKALALLGDLRAIHYLLGEKLDSENLSFSAYPDFMKLSAITRRLSKREVPKHILDCSFKKASPNVYIRLSNEGQENLYFYQPEASIFEYFAMKAIFDSLKAK